MDPLGFALENFDTVGAFHEVDPQSRQPIDTAATMPDGTELAGPEDLHKALAARGDQLAQIITEKLMTYAIGRPLDYRDMPSRAPHRARGARPTTTASRTSCWESSTATPSAAAKRPPLPKSTTAQAANIIPTSALAAP